MTEEIMWIGKAPEGAWRRENLLKLKNLQDKGSYWEVSFQDIRYSANGVKQTKLTYRIIK